MRTCFVFVSSRRIQFKGDGLLFLNQARSFFKGSRSLNLNETGPGGVSCGESSSTSVGMTQHVLVVFVDSP